MKYKVQSNGAHLGNYLAADFPGWGADNYADFLLPIEDGMVGTLTSTNSHGSAPYTRFCLKLENGGRIIDIDPALVVQV